jgi:hypothetical protein
MSIPVHGSVIHICVEFLIVVHGAEYFTNAAQINSTGDNGTSRQLPRPARALLATRRSQHGACQTQHFVALSEAIVDVSAICLGRKVGRHLPLGCSAQWPGAAQNLCRTVHAQCVETSANARLTEPCIN